jgi:lipoprotein-anchoring transpeptidase ErfK/SrfK
MRNFRGYCTVSVLVSALALLLSSGSSAIAQSISIYDDVPEPSVSNPQTRYETSPRVYYAVPRVAPNERTLRTPTDDIPDATEREEFQIEPSTGELPAQFRRQVVAYPSREPAGTIVIDTPNTYLYYVLGGGQAIRYGIGVGREGFEWSGVRKIERKAEWPDWIPPAEMIDRQPDLPRWMAGGPGNPLGARGMYLAGTLYRIHGTSDPTSIGKRVSSGCVRMLNEDVVDLYNRVPVGTKVVVLPDAGRRVADDASPRPPVARGQRTNIVPVDADVPETTYRSRAYSPTGLY